MIVVGVDGCKNGWIAAEWDIVANTLTIERLEFFGDVLNQYVDGAFGGDLFCQ